MTTTSAVPAGPVVDADADLVGDDTRPTTSLAARPAVPDLDLLVRAQRDLGRLRDLPAEAGRPADRRRRAAGARRHGVHRDADRGPDDAGHGLDLRLRDEPLGPPPAVHPVRLADRGRRARRARRCRRRSRSLVLFFVLLQLTSNAARGPFAGLVPDLVPERQVGIASGLMGLMITLGLVGGYLLMMSGYLLDEDFTLPMIALGAFVALAGIGSFLWIPKGPPGQAARGADLVDDRPRDLRHRHPPPAELRVPARVAVLHPDGDRVLHEPQHPVPRADVRARRHRAGDLGPDRAGGVGRRDGARDDPRGPPLRPRRPQARDLRQRRSSGRSG